MTEESARWLRFQAASNPGVVEGVRLITLAITTLKRISSEQAYQCLHHEPARVRSWYEFIQANQLSTKL